jgi:hypothetical protein
LRVRDLVVVSPFLVVMLLAVYHKSCDVALALLCHHMIEMILLVASGEAAPAKMKIMSK